MKFFSNLTPVCSVLWVKCPLYVVLLISFSLKITSWKQFLQMPEKKWNKSINYCFSKPKLLKVIPANYRICSQLLESQIKVIWDYFFCAFCMKANDLRSPEMEFSVIQFGQAIITPQRYLLTSYPASFLEIGNFLILWNEKAVPQPGIWTQSPTMWIVD